MAASVPDTFVDLLRPETRAFAHLALVLKDGSPQVTPIWFDYDGSDFLFNTARGRVKDHVLHRHPAVAFDIPDPTNPYRYLQVKGAVVDETEDGARQHIEKLNQKYVGNQDYPVSPGEVRVVYKVRPEKISTMG